MTVIIHIYFVDVMAVGQRKHRPTSHEDVQFVRRYIIYHEISFIAQTAGRYVFEKITRYSLL